MQQMVFCTFGAKYRNVSGFNISFFSSNISYETGAYLSSSCFGDYVYSCVVIISLGHQNVDESTIATAAKKGKSLTSLYVYTN